MRFVVFLNDGGSAVSEAEREKIFQAGEVLRCAGFCEANSLGALGIKAFPTVRERKRFLPELLERTAGGSPLQTFVRLFTLQQSVPIKKVREAISPMAVDDWQKLGLLRVVDEYALGAVELCLKEDVIAAADWPAEPGVDIHQVMGLAASSRALIQMTIRRNVERTLDLGTGCGIQSLLASRHSQNVSATDVNPRAVRYAQFNAMLNGASNITFSTGSLFEPAEGEKFDLIVCNPPFLIGPKMLYTHTSSGEPSDRFCETIVRNAPAHLNENGYAQIVCNWAQVGDETSQEHVGHWVESSGCDAWVLHSHTESAEDYAKARAEENASAVVPASALYDDWMAYFQRENITAVNFGLITLRRSSKIKNWVRYDELPGANGVCGKSIEIGFLLRDFLDTHRDDRQLLKTCLRCSPDLKVWGDRSGGPRPEKKRARLEHGLTFAATLDPDVADFVCSCKGTAPLKEYARKLSARKHIPMTYILPSFLMVVRHLIELGFLLPVELLSRIEQ
jgi:methylase of polypeptide subunit release factors